MLDREWTEPLPILAWAIEHPEGVIVVDAGETSRVAEPGYLPRWHPYYRLAVRLSVGPTDEIGPRLASLGISPADVRWVVLTHLHTDHAGGIHHFPNSEVLVSRAEHEAASGRLGKLRGYLPHRWPEWFAPRLVDFRADPFGPFPEGLRLTEAGDVRIVPTAGHTVGHASVVVTEEDGTTVFLAGDASYTQDLMLEGAVDGVAPDAAASGQTHARIRDLARDTRLVYLPAHDPGSEARLAARVPVAL
jgi:glyoxylase-like metal-dependent hydrolase (beta-lactamase superfamily II)